MLYKQEFGKDYPLGIRIPDYFKDQSFRHDFGPSFIYEQGCRVFQINVRPVTPRKQEKVYSHRYTLVEMKIPSGGVNYEFVDIHFGSDSPREFEKVIFDETMLKRWLGIRVGNGGFNQPNVVFLTRSPRNSI